MKTAPTTAAPRRPQVVVPALALGLLVIVTAVAYKELRTSSTTTTSATNGSDVSAISPNHPSARRGVPGAGMTGARTVNANGSSATEAGPPVDAKDLVSVLTALDGKEPVTPEEAKKWKDSLQRLIHQGASSVPAIQQYLAKNQDANYAGVSGAGELGYSSLRSAMLSALAQIPGTESTAAMLQTLQTSVYPTDIATLAQTLDAQAPGQYQDAILSAVRQQLAAAVADQLGGANVLPLFQVLATEAGNGAIVTDDLVQAAAKWPYYASIVLANLPDGVGVPSLIEMAQGSDAGNPTAAAEALAQVAPQNTAALGTLLQMAKGGQLSDAVLAQLAPYLGGEIFQLGPPANPTGSATQTMHFAEGNQDVSATDGSDVLTQAQIGQRISVIDQFLQAIPDTDSTAQQALQQQRTALAARLSK